MSEPNQSDHWDLLASALGAEVQKKSIDETMPPTEQVAPEVSEKSEENQDVQVHADQPLMPPEPVPPAPISSWDALALELGVEVKPDPTPQPEPTHRPAPKRPEKKAVFQAENPQKTFTPAPVEFGKNIEPAAASEAMPTVERTEKGGEKGGEKSGRHRRRHKGKDKKNRSTEPKKEQAFVSESQASAGIESTPTEDNLETAVKTDNNTEEYPKEVEAGKKDSKHRRSRRGSRKRRKKGSEITADNSGDAKGSSSAGLDEPGGSTEAFQPGDDDDEIADDEHDDHGRHGAKSGFRAIPTWDEAVGFIVAKNMEARPRRPGGGQSRSRSADSHKTRRK